VAGEGQHGVAGGQRGDLFLLVSVREHPRFERKGDDLVTDVPVPMLDAVLGGEVEVTTLDGRVALRIPELTQNGRQFRLKRKGMPVLGKAGERGDLIVRAKIQVPEHLSAEEREHFEALRELKSGRQAAATH
jgi:DnaJ-class molecular chaperone